LRICNPPQTQNEIAPDNAPPNWHEVSLGYNAEEIEVLIKLLREGAQVFRYYNTEPPSVETQHMSPAEFLANHQMANSGKEEKDLLESFATVFHHIDPAAFHEVFHSEIPNLYNMMFDNAALLHVPQFLLASEATSPSFAGMLLQFLMEKLDEVGTSDVKKSSILLRLFKLSFMAVTLFCAQNEQVLLPHVTKLITKSIQLS
ncbi:transcription-associated protein 1, partial [Cryomyces antarcticus]